MKKLPKLMKMMNHMMKLLMLNNVKTHTVQKKIKNYYKNHLVKRCCCNKKKILAGPFELSAFRAIWRYRGLGVENFSRHGFHEFHVRFTRFPVGGRHTTNPRFIFSFSFCDWTFLGFGNSLWDLGKVFIH